MRKISRFTATTAVTAISAVMFVAAMPAQAQDEPAPADTSGDQLETVATTDESGERVIVVTAKAYVPQGASTATKSDIPLVETPQSVSVVSRDQIDLLNFVDAQQAVRYVAGATGENYGPDLRFDFIQVRGFPPKQFIDGLATPVTTTIFSNGVDLYAFESLDILKGPASVLYGSAPPGGIYNQTSRRPSTEFGGEVSLKYGEDDFKQLGMTATGAATDWLDLRATVMVRDRDAERDFVHAQRIYAAPAATVHIGPDTRLTALAYYQYDDVKGDTNGFLPVQGTLLPNPNGPIRRDVNLGEPDYNRYVRDQWGAGFELEHDFGRDWKATINARWSDYSERQDVLYNAFLNADNRTITRSIFPYAEDVKSFGIDGRMAGKVATGAIEHTILAGIDHRTVQNEAFFGFLFAAGGTIDIYNPVYNVGAPYPRPAADIPYADQHLNQTGAYLQDQLAIGGLRLLFSGRYDWVDLESFGTAKDQHKFTWRAGASYVTPSGFVPYISFGTSFEPTLGINASGEAFRPTTGEQWEAGIKYDGRDLGSDVDLLATAALFQIKQQNVASASYGPVTAPPLGATQSGEVEVKGAELEFVARIRNQLAINGSYAYTDSEVTKSEVAVEIGEPLPVTPKHKASLFADYTFQRGGLGGFGFGAGVRYVSKSAGSLPGPFNAVVYTSDSSTLFDAIVHYDLPDWRFAINGSNVFDKRYVARCAGPNNCTFGAGRQVIGTATYKF
ncbi:TonB-dependent siderophore receptor [Tsuneonella rigui]|uniref:TonB-dependent siderophore receptor n=1 Tax=Tsuneonella rigui TaxID=1708790 RepID=UPI001F4994DE|nr:TonB-dependent siderophore receptor [Tsuneonella rigui]